MKNIVTKILTVILFISSTVVFAVPVSSKHPFNLFFIQEVNSGQLILNAKNQGTLTVKISDKPLISFNANNQQKLTGYVELTAFIKAIKKTFENDTFNTALIIDNKDDPNHKNVYIVALSNPHYNSKIQTLKYNVLLLMHQTSKESKTVTFEHGVLLYDQVCISCYFGR